MTLADLTPDQYSLLLRAARKISDDDERGQFFHYVGSRIRMSGPEDLLAACRDGLQLFGSRPQCRGCN
jgi:hypothetical protein